jgi:flagellar hook-associated protein 2
MSQVSISGAITGLDTASIINQLMSVEAAQQTAIKNRQSTAKKAADAYATLMTSLSGLAEKATALAKTSAWKGATATSSSESVRTAVTGTPSGALQFDVTALATAHALVSDTTVAATSAVVVGGGTLSVKDANGVETASIDVGGGTLAEVVSAINSSDAGLRASAVKTADGAYRLQVAAAKTGATSEFTLDGVTGFGSMGILAQGADATIKVGDILATQYTITSASNTFSDVIPGLSFTVSKLENDVTVEATVDGTEVAKSVKELVDAANTVLSDLKKQSAYDSSTKSGGPLYGESAIRRLQEQILSTVGGAGAPGVSLTRDGRLSFDETKFKTAFTENPDRVAKAYGYTSTFTPTAGVSNGVRLSQASTTARAGTYSVAVSIAAAKEQWRLDPPGGDLSGKTVVITQGSLTASYTVGAGESLADAVSAINSRARQAGITASANVQIPSSVQFTADTAGASHWFQVTVDGALGTHVTSGTDAVGSIDGVFVDGNGGLLTVNDATSGANGLTLDVSDITTAEITATGGDIGVIEYSPGLAQKLAGLLEGVSNSRDGALARAKTSRLDDVKNLQNAIDSWDRRLEARRLALTRQFTAMETAISTLKSKTSALSGL